ncbi:MAG: hypothetical protein KDE53_10870 [Caldilineaceae bacterium]|nr:hypothetical protein [Caldilineaceae bacterium]
MSDPKVTRLEIHEYQWQLPNMGKDYNGFNLIYEPGNTITNTGRVLKLFTDAGIVGEYAGGSPAEFSTIPQFWHFLKGHSVLERERFYTEVRRALRQVARIGFAPIDIALWDIAGKLYNQPIYKLLGGYKTDLPCYASTYHGDHQPDGLLRHIGEVHEVGVVFGVGVGEKQGVVGKMRRNLNPCFAE